MLDAHRSNCEKSFQKKSNSNHIHPNVSDIIRLANITSRGFLLSKHGETTVLIIWVEQVVCLKDLRFHTTPPCQNIHYKLQGGKIGHLLLGSDSVSPPPPQYKEGSKCLFKLLLIHRGLCGPLYVLLNTPQDLSVMSW